jgi:shikimate dehydrogenase
MRKFGLIGFPLTHSFSPAFFEEKFSKEGLPDCTYQLYPIESIERFPMLLEDNELEGINVTIPYKKSIIPYLNSTTAAVNKIAACNCIKIRNGFLTGHNTDVIGFEKSLSPHLTDNHTHALVLGTGGSAAAVEFVLEKLGIEYQSVSRNASPANNNLTYHQLDEDVLHRHKLIINTTPLGMFPSVDSCPDIPYQFLSADHYLFDLVYNPPQTLFLKKGSEKGAITKNGSDMLIIQAEESWKIWNEGR